MLLDAWLCLGDSHLDKIRYSAGLGHAMCSYYLVYLNKYHDFRRSPVNDIDGYCFWVSRGERVISRRRYGHRRRLEKLLCIPLNRSHFE